LLIVSLTTLSSLSYATEEEEILANAMHRLNERWEEVYYEFSDLALKTYCPREYDQMTDMLLQLSRQDRRITLSSLRHDRDLILEELMSACEHEEMVLGLDYRFTHHVATHSAAFLSRLETLLTNQAIEVDLESKRALVDQMVEVVLEQDFNASKILDLLVAPLEEQSLVRALYLLRGVSHSVGAGLGEAQAPGAAAPAAGGGGGSSNAAAGGGGSSASVNPVSQQGPGQSLASQAAPVAEKKSRCPVCKKKLGLLGFECKCERIFCASHRPPEEHACTFDYRAQGKSDLTKSLPVVTGDKVPDRI
jgi:hypothetical protein